MSWNLCCGSSSSRSGGPVVAMRKMYGDSALGNATSFGSGCIDSLVALAVDATRHYPAAPPKLARRFSMLSRASRSGPGV